MHMFLKVCRDTQTPAISNSRCLTQCQEYNRVKSYSYVHVPRHSYDNHRIVRLWEGGETPPKACVFGILQSYFQHNTYSSGQRIRNYINLKNWLGTKHIKHQKETCVILSKTVSISVNPTVSMLWKWRIFPEKFRVQVSSHRWINTCDAQVCNKSKMFE